MSRIIPSYLSPDVISRGEKEIFEPLLTQFNIESEFFGNNEIEIIINKAYESAVIFYDEKDYLQRFGNYANEFENYLFAILKIDNTYLLNKIHKLEYNLN